MWPIVLAKLKSWSTWILIGLAVLVLILIGQVKLAKAEAAKQKDRAKRWEKTARLESEKVQRAHDLAAEQEAIRKAKDERVAQIHEVLEKKKADAAAVDKEVHAHVDRTGSAAAEAKRLREERERGG